jgi:transposase
VSEAERTCPGCGAALEPLGTEDSEQIDWQVTITRIVHRRCRYRRRCPCPGPRTVTAPVPPKPIGKGRFTAAFLARLLSEKYVLGLHRIARALAAEGLDVAEGTLCGALKDVHALLAPLQRAIADRNAAAGHVHVDETGWRVFEQVEGKDGTRWWLWVFVAADTVVFTMDPTRSTAVLQRHFMIDRAVGALPEGRRLVLSSDFVTVYQSLARVQGVDPLWCWARIRRYFIRAGDAHTQWRYCVTGGCNGSRCCTWPIGIWPPPNPALTSTATPARTSTMRWSTSTPPATSRSPSPACTRPPARCWPPWIAKGTDSSATATSPTSRWTTTPPKERYGPR